MNPICFICWFYY